MAKTAQQKVTFLSVFLNGLITENPTFTLMLGMCPTLGVTTAAMNGVGMGLATTFVLMCSNLFISLLRNIIPDKVRIPAYIIVIASFVTMIDLLMQAFLPDLRAVLGTYIQLIVVNCIIFARAESFAAKNPPLLSLSDGLGMGLGFTCSITLLSCIRELFGSGSIFGVAIMPESYQPMAIMNQVPGGFITLGIMLVVVNFIKEGLKNRRIRKEAEA
ncbi:MAG: electron transport complex subunit E [Clostridia bacterium]|nr:electron transport complex subunit E [Clostridia bacterium]